MEARKNCNACGEDLALSSFGPHKKSPDGLTYACRSCLNKQNRQRYSTPEYKARRRSYDMRRKYGITAEEWDRLWDKQGRGCALCGSSTRPCVDHCHETGRVRGILCSACNTAVGILGDNAESLRNVVAYLEGVDLPG